MQTILSFLAPRVFSSDFAEKERTKQTGNFIWLACQTEPLYPPGTVFAFLFRKENAYPEVLSTTETFCSRNPERSSGSNQTALFGRIPWKRTCQPTRCKWRLWIWLWKGKKTLITVQSKKFPSERSNNASMQKVQRCGQHHHQNFFVFLVCHK